MTAEAYRHMAARFRAEGHYATLYGRADEAALYWQAATEADRTATRMEKENQND